MSRRRVGCGHRVDATGGGSGPGRLWGFRPGFGGGRAGGPPRRVLGCGVVGVVVLLASLLAFVPVAGAEDGVGGFEDVPASSWFAPGVGALAEAGVFEGTDCAEGMFCFGEALPRWMMAVWLVRAVDGADPLEAMASRFEDVDAGVWWAAHTERLAELGITAGCSADPVLYCPDRLVTRAQMATFLVRAFGVEAAEPAGFVDVAGSVHEINIDALAAAGVTAGCSTEPFAFCPQRSVTKAQMATFLARALGLIPLPGSAPSEPEPEPEPSEPASGYRAVSAGSAHSCGVRTNGEVTCWGNNEFGQVDAPAGEFISVSADGAHSCGLRVDGTVACWGDNSSRQSEAFSGEFLSVSVGRNHSCGLRVDGRIGCWGDNELGQREAHKGEFVSLSSGENHSCGVRVDGAALCWGYNEFGQSYAPLGLFTAVSAGSWHSCGLRPNGSLVCWGDSALGQLDTPDGRFTAVSAGGFHSCALDVYGEIVCWGNNEHGQLLVPGGEFTSVSAGAYHSCGLRVDGGITCWGRLAYILR